jgi:hypothetical protein
MCLFSGLLDAVFFDTSEEELETPPSNAVKAEVVWLITVELGPAGMRLKVDLSNRIACFSGGSMLCDSDSLKERSSQFQLGLPASADPATFMGVCGNLSGSRLSMLCFLKDTDFLKGEARGICGSTR